MIERAEYIKGYQLRLFFDNNIIKDIDLFDFLNASKLPEVRKCLKFDYFQQFKVENGNLCWGDEFEIESSQILKGKLDIRK
jgi:hypothetical protein